MSERKGRGAGGGAQARGPHTLTWRWGDAGRGMSPHPQFPHLQMGTVTPPPKVATGTKQDGCSP